MSSNFDPNIPSTGPTSASIEGEFVGLVGITETPAIGNSNFVINGKEPFDIEVTWKVFGTLVPLWLTALSAQTPNWVVTAYAESQGPGDEKIISTVNVPVGGPNFKLTEQYSAKLRVLQGALPEENPGDPTQSGTYKIIVTVFLDSKLGEVGYDMMGYADGPIVKVENPV